MILYLFPLSLKGGLMTSMINGYVQPLLAFAGQNVWLVATIVFFAALSEAIVLVV